VRLGLPNQDPIGWFADTLTPQPISHQLTTAFHQATTSGEVDRLRFDFVAPGGLYRTNDDGERRSVTITLQFEYRVSGSSTWAPLPVSHIVEAYTDETVWLPVPDTISDNPTNYITYVPTGAEYLVDGRWYVNVPDGDGGTIAQQVGYVRQVANYSASHEIRVRQASAVRRSLISIPLPEAIYDVRVRRTTPVQGTTDPAYADQLAWGDLTEIVNEDIHYGHSALLALKIRMSEQLNGIPNVTHLNHGKLIRVWDDENDEWGYMASSNPAWVTFDILSNSRYGGGAPLSRFNLEKWKEWARWCRQEDLEFNGVFDAMSNCWDAAQHALRCGHAQLVRSGTKYTVAIERAEPHSMMFTVGNMIQGSFKESWMGMQDRANEIEGTFHDEANNYKQRTIKVYDQAALAAGRPQRTTNVDLRGVTNAQQAWDDLNILLNINRYIQRTVEFSAPITALGCTIGSVVLIQHDQPSWGDGGRVESGNASTIVLDREIRMEHGNTYSLLVKHSALMRYSGTVSSVLNNSDSTSLLLTGFTGAIIPQRLVINGEDVEVLNTYQSGASHGVTVRPLSGVTPGVTTYQLWCTDVIETRSVVNPAIVGTPYEGQSVTVTVPFTATPEPFAVFMFGQTTKVAKPFRIKSISGSHEYQRDIVAQEYNATVYDPAGAVPTPNYSDLPLGVAHVTIDGVTEDYVPDGFSYQSRVTVHFSSIQQTYQHSNVYVSRNGGAWEWIGRDVYSVGTTGITGESLVFKVVAMDVLGQSAPDSSAPTYAHVVQGRVTPPGNVTGLSYSFTDTGVSISWAAPIIQDWVVTRARLGADFDTGVQVYEAQGTRFELPFQAAGTHRIGVKHIRQSAIESELPTYMDIVVDAPLAPEIQGLDLMPGAAMLRWADARTDQPIRHYLIRIATPGTAWADADEIARPARTASSASVIIPAEGTRRLMIRAEDMGGNLGPIDYVDFTNTSTNSVILATNSLVFRVEEDGSFEPAVIDMVATLTGALAGSVATFTTVPAGITLAGTNNARTLSYAAMGANNSVQITASVTLGGDTYTDTVTIIKLTNGVEGEDAISFVLSNEATTVPADSEGEVSDFSGAVTELTIYRGTQDDTANWSFSKRDVNVRSTLDGSVVEVYAMGPGLPYSPPSTLESNNFDLIENLGTGFSPINFDLGTSTGEEAGLTDTGWVEITASRPGFSSQIRRFIVTKSRRGAEGPPGSGTRGNVNIAYAITGTAWSDALALLALIEAGYGAPMVRDIVTLYNTAAGFSETRFWSGTAWLVINHYLSGNVFVERTLSADALIAHTITATELIETEALITNTAQMGTAVVGTAAIADLSVGTLKVQGEAITVPRFAVAAPGTLGSSSETTILTLPTMDASRGDGTYASVALVGSIEVSAGTTSVEAGDSTGDYTVRLKRNGVTIKTISFPGFSGYALAGPRSHSLSMIDTPSSSSTTYTVTIQASAGGSGGTSPAVHTVEVLALAAKR
jgi:hypothetical protein